MRIESGASNERKIRITIAVLALLAGGLWFAYDGWIGWPAENLAAYRDQFPPDQPSPWIDINPNVTEQVVARVEPLRSIAEIETLLGGPPTLRSDRDLRWFGQTGTLVVELQNGRPARALFKAARRSATDILFQKAIAIVLLAGFGFALKRLLRIRAVRYVLDDAGLTFDRTGPIPWDRMKRLDTDRYVEKGWVDLEYADGAGTSKLRLDSYEIAAFDDIIDELCRRKGFENPLPVETDGQSGAP